MPSRESTDTQSKSLFTVFRENDSISTNKLENDLIHVLTAVNL